MRLIKYVLVVGFIVFGFAYVKANKTRNFQYKAPTGFTLEDNFFPAFIPTVYKHTGAEQVTVMIPPEVRSKIKAPKTASGELHPEFLQGKRNFNQQFGIENWNVKEYKFSNTNNGERLELSGSYTSMAGVKTEFLEHHYFGKSVIQSIHMFYPEKSVGKVVEQAKLSLQNFNPNIN
jgi:hypothetical protein